MILRAIRIAMLAAALGAGTVDAQGPPPDRGRPLRVEAQQALDFGELLGGLPQLVPSTDPVNAARIRISGRGGSEVLVTFLLPVALEGPGGGAVPLAFGPGSAGYSPGEDIAGQLAFDPEASSVFMLPQNGRGTIYLGGTALPPAQVIVGAYAATITLTVSYIGS